MLHYVPTNWQQSKKAEHAVERRHGLHGFEWTTANKQFVFYNLSADKRHPMSWWTPVLTGKLLFLLLERQLDVKKPRYFSRFLKLIKTVVVRKFDENSRKFFMIQNTHVLKWQLLEYIVPKRYNPNEKALDEKIANLILLKSRKISCFRLQSPVLPLVVIFVWRTIEHACTFLPVLCCWQSQSSSL